jgi:hypothetical protein
MQVRNRFENIYLPGAAGPLVAYGDPPPFKFPPVFPVGAVNFFLRTAAFVPPLNIYLPHSIEGMPQMSILPRPLEKHSGSAFSCPGEVNVVSLVFLFSPRFKN